MNSGFSSASCSLDKGLSSAAGLAFPLRQVSLWLLHSVTVLPDPSRSGPCSCGRASGDLRHVDVCGCSLDCGHLLLGQP